MDIKLSDEHKGIVVEYQAQGLSLKKIATALKVDHNIKTSPATLCRYLMRWPSAVSVTTIEILASSKNEPSDNLPCNISQPIPCLAPGSPVKPAAVSLALLTGLMIFVFIGVAGYLFLNDDAEPANPPSPFLVEEFKIKKEYERLAKERAEFEAEKLALEADKSRLAASSPTVDLQPALAAITPGAATSSATDSLLMKLLSAAARNAAAEVEALKAQAVAAPKPPRGNRILARNLNAEAIQLIHNNRITEAVALFQDAASIDPADVEIVENFGYAALKSGDLEVAKRNFFSALRIAPGRSTAWANLGAVLAQTESEELAVAAFLTAYRFAENKANSVESFKKLAETIPNPKVIAAVSRAYDVLRTTKSNGYS